MKIKLKIKKIQGTKLHAIHRFPAGSFAVHIGDHLRLGITCGRGSFAALYSTVQWYFSRVDVYLHFSRLLRSDIKQCCGWLNFI